MSDSSASADCGALRHCTLVMVEDNPADVQLLEQAFHQRGFAADITLFRNGLEAWEALRRLAQEGGPAPDMILLDDRLPDIRGSELYRRITAEAHFRSTILFVFSGMPAERLEKQGIRPEAILPKPEDWAGYQAVFDKVLALLQQVPCALKKLATGGD